jgi:outer membrane protein
VSRSDLFRAARTRHRSALALAVILLTGGSLTPARAQTAARGAAAGNPLADSLRLSLSETIGIALQQATPLQVARADQRVAAAQVLSAYGRFLPTVGAGASVFGEQGTALLSQTTLAPYDATFHGATVGLSAGITLFDGLRDQAGLRAAIAQRDASAWSLTRVREEIVNDVTEAFYRVVLDDRLTVVSRANLELSRQRLTQLEAQVKEGVKAPPDLYRQQALTRDGEAAVIAAEARGSSDRIALLRRLRLDPRHPLSITAPADDSSDQTLGGAGAPAASDSLVSALDVTTLSQTALAQRPDLAAAGALRRAAEAGVSQARGALLPRVALQLDLVDAARVFDRQQQNGVNLLTAQTALAQSAIGSQLGRQMAGVVTLGVSVPVFDRWQSRAEIERAQAVAEVSRLREDDLHDRVIGEVAQAVDEIRSAALTITAATAQVAAAQKAYDAVSGRYDVGMASFIDVASAQTELTRSKSNREAAIVSQALARQRLASAIGTDTAGADGAGRSGTLPVPIRR